MDWPRALGQAEEIDIETRRDPGAPIHRTTIWPVVDEGEVYVRSLNGEAGRWYAEALANPEVVLHVDGEELRARAVPAADEQSVGRATSGFQRKYADSPYLESMVREDILATTLRLDPR